MTSRSVIFDMLRQNLRGITLDHCVVRIGFCQKQIVIRFCLCLVLSDS